MTRTAHNVENNSEEQSVLTFDDSLFESDDSHRPKTQPPTQNLVMQPNIVSPKWFMSPVSDESPQTMKYRGDCLFYKKDYRAAAAVYEHCIKHVPSSNRTLLRDAVESKIWCFLKLEEFEIAKELSKDFTEELIASSTTFEQRTPALFLSTQLYRRCGLIEELTLALKRGLCVHPLYPEWWLELAKPFLTPPKDDRSIPTGKHTPSKSFNFKFVVLCLSLAQSLAQRQENYSSSFAVLYAQNFRQSTTKLLERLPDVSEKKLNISKCVEHLLDCSTNTKKCLDVDNFEQTILKWSETTTVDSDDKLTASLLKVDLQ